MFRVTLHLKYMEGVHYTLHGRTTSTGHLRLSKPNTVTHVHMHAPYTEYSTYGIQSIEGYTILQRAEHT